MLINDDRAAVPELYSQACTSSNLRCEADKRGAADILIASGMSGNGLGGALMRLHTKPDRAGMDAIHQHLTDRARLLNIDRPEAVSAAVLSWWLNRICNSCNGVKFEVVPGSPSLSARSCKRCQGSGEKKLPYGSEGRRLEDYMQDCLNRWRQLTAKRLRPAK